MKKLFFKILSIGLFLLAMPVKQFAQIPYVNYADEGVILNFHEIDNIDFRLYLLYSLGQDDRFTLTPDVENGVFIVNGKSFESFYNETYTNFALLSKEDRYELVFKWKECVSPSDFASIMMDVASRSTRNDNDHCIDSHPFCTTDIIQFDASSSTQQAEYIPDKGCLGMTYNPSWYHMKINIPGQFIIHMEGRDPNTNEQRDIDFCIWGPFTHPTTPCTSQLTTNKIIDCSYSSSYSEDIYLGYQDNLHHHGTSGTSSHGTVNYHLPEAGEYYILLITNFSRDPCRITFTKTANSGPGETDCGILPGIASNTGPYCVGDVIALRVNSQDGATYSWTGPNGFTSTQQNPQRPNCTMAMAGTYTCVTTVGTQSVTANTEVQIHPRPTANFTATSVCKGESTQFTNSSTTNPSNQSMTYLWNFGDGQTSNQTNPSHTYAEAGNYSVTLTANCGNAPCPSTKTQSVTVYQTPVASATATNSVVQYGGTTQLHGSGGTGSFTYHWEPANKVVNANTQNPQTTGLTETTTFTLTVTQPQGGCSSTAQVIVSVQGSNMTASASASPSSICRGGTTQLQAMAVGGNANNYSYLWSPSLSLSDPLIANPVASPTTTTTYNCTVSDGYTTQQVSTTVTVNQPEYPEITQYICPGDTYNFYGEEYSDVGDYTYQTTTSQGCEKVITLHLRHYPSYENAHTTTEYICPGYSFNFHGQYFNTTGLHPVDLHTVHGCDSIVWLNLTVYPDNDTIIVDPTICTSQTYNFHGVEYNHDGDIAYFDTIDNHGCLLVEKLVLSVGPYQMPPMQQQFECFPHDGSPSYYWDKTGQTYTQDTYDEIILPDPEGGCDIKYRLNLKFHQEFYRTDTLTVCDEYDWHATPGVTYTTTNHNLVKVFHDVGGQGFACDSTFVLDLTVNHSTNDTIQVLNQCDQYDWQFGWNNETYTLTEQDNYTKTIDTYLGCDSIVTLKLQLDYTPSFPKVEGKKWVVGGSEFQYTVEKYWITPDHPQSTHETTWDLHDKDGNPFNKWEILPYGNNYDNCYLYIYTFERDTIWLHAHTESTGDCACGSDDKEMWIVCGYHNVEETLDPITVDIFPNPNDGNMTLLFDNMEGETFIKVYNITGTLVDQLTLHNEFGHLTYTYQSGRLSPGVYFFNIANKKGILTKKVIILD